MIEYNDYMDCVVFYFVRQFYGCSFGDGGVKDQSGFYFSSIDVVIGYFDDVVSMFDDLYVVVIIDLCGIIGEIDIWVFCLVCFEVLIWIFIQGVYYGWLWVFEDEEVFFVCREFMVFFVDNSSFLVKDWMFNGIWFEWY